MLSTTQRSIFVSAFFSIIVILASLTPTNAWAFCCNGFTTQSCADCNIFWCNCSNPCDCQNSCKANCMQEYNQCLIYCTQGNCSYCDGYLHACENRCPSSSAKTLPKSNTIAKGKANAKEPAACQKIYQAIDTDRNGVLSQDEFVAFIEAQRKLPKQNDGESPTVRANLGSMAGQKPADVFNHYDKNHDGLIDRKEAGVP